MMKKIMIFLVIKSVVLLLITGGWLWHRFG